MKKYTQSSKHIVSHSSDGLYKEHENEPISTHEVEEILFTYRKPFFALNFTEYQAGTRRVFLDGYYNILNGSNWTTASHKAKKGIVTYNIYNGEIDDIYIIFDSIEGHELDIKLIYKIYKSRTVLMKINPLYALEKTKEYYSYVLSLARDTAETYLVLAQQCLALQKYFPTYSTNLGQDIPLLNAMIQKWFQKKESKATKIC